MLFCYSERSSILKKLFIASLILNLLIIPTCIVILVRNHYPKQTTTTIMESDNYKYRLDMFNTLPMEKQSIVFLGDSHTERCEWAELFQNSDIINRGIDGDTTEGLFSRVHNITILKPNKIFIMIGVNDILAHTPSVTTIENYRQVIEAISWESPNTKIYLQSVLPISESINKEANADIVAFNNEIQKLAQTYNVTYINLYDKFYTRDGLNEALNYDGLHLNGKGYLLWRELITNYIE